MKNRKPYIPAVLHLISANIARWGNPLGLSNEDCTSWATGLQIPTMGSSILYTGCEYQMTSYVQSLRNILKRVKFRDTIFTTFQSIQGLARVIGVDVTKVYTQVSKRERKTYDGLLRMATLTLRKLNVDFAYLDAEPYTGALLYEYGLFEEFHKQAQRVADQFRRAGLTRIITLSPHSAEILQQVYPKFLSNFDFEVTTYVSTIADALTKSGKELSLPKPLSVTLHDPCHLARSLGVTEEPREVLRAIRNLNLKEVASNRQLTVCCGAPCELIYPELAELAAAKRVRELAETGAKAAITLCPFCHANLTSGVRLTGKNLKIIDFIEIVYQALEGGNAGYQSPI